MAYNPRDSYYKKAKREGYRSRAAYKLIELQRRFQLLRSGDLVVDLGAAPGGWLQVAAKIVGPRGRVIGVDLLPMEGFSERHITVVEGDITSPEIQAKIKALLGAAPDCILSDLAPKLSGIRDADTARCLELNETALSVAGRLLRPTGNLLLKGFVSDDIQGFALKLKSMFRIVERTRPDATRQASSEFYFCAKDFCSNTEDG